MCMHIGHIFFARTNSLTFLVLIIYAIIFDASYTIFSKYTVKNMTFYSSLAQDVVRIKVL